MVYLVKTPHINVHMIGTIVVHNTAQNSSDNLPSYPPHNY